MLAIFRLEQKATVLRELATMLKAGMALGEALHVLESRAAYPALRQVICEGAKRVSAGERFSEVLAGYPEEFPELTVAVIAMGEQTGRLDEAFERVAGYLEREYDLRQMISRETFYPKVILVFAILIPSAIPALIEAIMGSIWLAFWILFKSLALWALILGIPIGLVYLVYRAIISTREGRQGIDWLKLHIPLIGPVVRRLALAKFARALSYAYAAGVPMGQAVSLSGRVTGNAILEQHFREAVPLVRKGYPLSQALSKARDIDDMALRMLQTGEQTGEIDATMARVAEHFETAAETSIHRMAVMALPIGVIIVGIIVAIILVNFYASYYSQF